MKRVFAHLEMLSGARGKDMARYRKCFAYLICLALLVSGCGGRSTGAGENQRVIPGSKLVAKADAERILGVPVRLVTDEISQNQSSCLYSGTNDERGNPSSLMTNLIVTSSEDSAIGSFETALKEGKRMGSLQPIAGLGDEAQLASGSPATLAIYVRKGWAVFYLTAVGTPNAKPSLDAMKSLARRITAQL